MLYHVFSEEELRSATRRSLETLELWLRRVIDSLLTASYGHDYLNYEVALGGRIIRKDTADKALERMTNEPTRYQRLVDGLLLDDIINIICKPYLYNKHFKVVFVDGFPQGGEVLRTYLKRLSDPRNHLSHSNPISVRQAEQCICYSNDIIDAIKKFYMQNNASNQYNVPRFINFKDSFGNVQNFDVGENSLGQHVFYSDKPEYDLRPGDSVWFSVEVDSSFSPDEYEIKWASTKDLSDLGNTSRIVLSIEEKHVAQSFDIQVSLKSKKTWHRLSNGNDDHILAYYKVLPPME
jgi:hypothetical protein